MKTLNRRDFPGAQYPERIIQFGEGNFLRAFIDWQIDLLNEHTDLNAGVVIVRPIEETHFRRRSAPGWPLHHDYSRPERERGSGQRCASDSLGKPRNQRLCGLR